ncbi:FtsX-like permease family protein [Acrocarpospora catenulata]|uniref:FtsX-like permease family protein n=1 Tax=Acrocarpospora catenulata TaxID=2836182 RepID=UPI001BD959FA|nr:FtsX-like permease family protein [Acrocarpospora catenulata]
MNAWRLILVHRGAAGVLALLALTASLLVAGLPRSFEQAYDEALTVRLDEVSAQQTDLTVSLRPNMMDDQIASPAGFADLDADWRGNLPPLLRTAVQAGGTSHFSAKTYGTPVMGRIGSPAKARQYVDIAWVSGIEDRVRYVAGRPPGPPRTLAEVPGHPELKNIPYFEIGLVADAEQRMALPIGTKVLLANSYTVVAEVVGLFEPVDPEDRFWEHNEGIRQVLERRLPDDNLEYYATGLVPAEGLRFLDSRRELTYNWVLGLNPASVNARNAPTLIEEIEDFRRYVTSQGGQESYGPARLGNARFDLVTGLDPLLTGYLTELRSAQTLVFLIIGGLVVVAIGVIALAVHLFSERMRGSLGLARARGASLAQVTATGTAATALAAVPGALAGYGLSFLIPGPVTPVVHLAPLALALAAVGFAAVRLALAHRRPLTDSRADLVAAKPSPRRVAAEVLVIVLALAGAYALRSRGLSTDVAERGADPFLALVPAALTLAGALITLRCYPLPLRLVLRLAARRRGAVPFLGVTLAARSRGATSLPVLILLPALAVSVFGALVSGAIGETQRLAAWQHVGAQARVERAAEIPADVAAKVAALPGVTAVVPAAKGTVQLATGGQTATVLAIDLDAYRSLVAGSPLAVPAAPTGPGIPALVSKSFVVYPSFEIGWHTRMKINNVGDVTELPGLAYPGNLIVMPYEGPKLAGLRTYTNMLLISGNVGREALEAAVGLEDAVVETFDESLGRISSAPLTGTITTGFTVVTVAMGGYALIAVVLALVIGAADRSKTLSFLRTLGLSQRQARLLTVLEVAPLIVLTSLAGLAIGLGLPAALGPGLDLSAYAGIAVTDFPLTFTTPALLAAGLAAVSILGALAHATAGRRMTTAIRVGESS